MHNTKALTSDSTVQKAPQLELAKPTNNVSREVQYQRCHARSDRSKAGGTPTRRNLRYHSRTPANSTADLLGADGSKYVNDLRTKPCERLREVIRTA